ncbi:DMT family transporter [Planktotalea sp.]|uniref:DMT family transporter n=1 Tax=Planktotalea sp. TaxID=2029877 RepID=UPI003F6C3405
MNARNDFLTGIGLRLLATFLMTAMSAAVRVTADTVPLGQLIFWRSFLALFPICLYMVWWREFPSALRTKHPRLHVTRSLLGIFAMAMFFTALAYLPLANAQALGYLAPILVLPLAAFLLKEKLTVHIFGAVFFGFTGVLFLLWDAFTLPSEGALIGVAAGLIFAFTMAFVRVHTKTMTQTESSASIAFYLALVGSVVGLATIAFGWITLSTTMFGWLALAGFLGGIGHIVANEATARAPVSTLAPFDFAGLIWALGFDVILFSTVPGPMGLIGVFAITFAALMVTFLGPSTSKPVEH